MNSEEKSGMSGSKFRHDLMASIVVFLVALPLCMGIAIASGVPVAAGLITGIVGGIVVGSIAGCPLQVSGPAAGLTVIIYEIVQEYGLEALGVIVLVAGLMQALAGVLRLGQWFRAVSPAVIKGMLAGIGVLIFASQFHVMVDDKPKGSGIENLVTIPHAIVKALDVPDFRSQESRRFHKQMLQRVGEVHRRQVELQERVGELFPHVHDPEIDFDPSHLNQAQSQLQEFAESQKGIRNELTNVTDELRELEQHLDSDKRAEAVEAAAAEAEDQLAEALATIQNGTEPSAMLEAQDESVVVLEQLLARLKNHHIAAYLGIASILSILLWNFVPEKVRVIPGPLIAVVIATVAAVVLKLPVLYVEIPDRLWEGIHFPSMVVVREVTIPVLIQSGLLIAAVASAETLLCATAVDRMQDGERTDYNRELFAQGVGNTVCGILGVLPMTGVIVRSSANIQAGATSRLSAILHGIWLLLFVAALGFVLRQIPTASLAAILVYTGFKLVDIKGIRTLAAYGKGEVLIYAVTVATIVIEDLLTGVLVGIALAGVKLLYTFSHLQADLEMDRDKQLAELHLCGAATFIRLPLIASKLESVPRGAELHVHFEQLDYIDHACLELMMTWAKQHQNTGGRLVIDWESLHARFQNGGRLNGGNKSQLRTPASDSQDQIVSTTSGE